jgi:hypothetical protein
MSLAVQARNGTCPCRRCQKVPLSRREVKARLMRGGDLSWMINQVYYEARSIIREQTRINNLPRLHLPQS